MGDVLRSHRFYKKAAHCVINVYLRLHDKPLKDKDDLDDGNPDNLAPSELKKLRNKQRKAAKRPKWKNKTQIKKKPRKKSITKPKRKITKRKWIHQPKMISFRKSWKGQRMP